MYSAASAASADQPPRESTHKHRIACRASGESGSGLLPWYVTRGASWGVVQIIAAAPAQR
eukprot:4517151-Pleurochrysis_carterae.AAC.1